MQENQNLLAQTESVSPFVKVKNFASNAVVKTNTLAQTALLSPTKILPTKFGDAYVNLIQNVHRFIQYFIPGQLSYTAFLATNILILLAIIKGGLYVLGVGYDYKSRRRLRNSIFDKELAPANQSGLLFSKGGVQQSVKQLSDNVANAVSADGAKPYGYGDFAVPGQMSMNGSLGGSSGKPVSTNLIGSRLRPESTANSVAQISGLKGRLPVNTSHGSINKNADLNNPTLTRVAYNDVHDTSIAKGPPVLDAIVDPNTDFINSAVFVSKRRGTAIYDLRGEASETIAKSAGTITAPVPTWGPFDGGPHDEYREPLDRKLPAQRQFLGGGGSDE